MMIEIASILAGVAIILIATSILTAAKHISNSDKHPCKKDIVFNEVCKPKMKALEDCIETEIRERKEAFIQLREDMKTGFKTIIDLVKERKNEE
jgi:hypothetical protein